MIQALLVLTPGKWQGKLIALSRPIFVIGRDPLCNLRPASTAISDRHCVIIRRDGESYLQDLESTSGTFVNGKRLTGQVKLEEDDCIKVGPIEFAVREQREAAATGTDSHTSLRATDTPPEKPPLPPPEPKRH